MPRPVKTRKVESVPGITCFKPAGIPMRLLEVVVVSVEEAEALRLKDIEKLEQEQCAERMQVSRATFQRVLSSAREKVSGALLNGKAIRIEGGIFELSGKKYCCRRGNVWDITEAETIGCSIVPCPDCESRDVPDSVLSENR